MRQNIPKQRHECSFITKIVQYSNIGSQPPIDPGLGSGTIMQVSILPTQKDDVDLPYSNKRPSS